MLKKSISVTEPHVALGNGVQFGNRLPDQMDPLQQKKKKEKEKNCIKNRLHFSMKGLWDRPPTTGPPCIGEGENCHRPSSEEMLHKWDEDQQNPEAPSLGSSQISQGRHQKDKEPKVVEPGKWEGGRWKWVCRWRRELRGGERVVAGQLMKELDSCQLKLEKDDRWIWKFAKNGMYSVKEAYEGVVPWTGVEWKEQFQGIGEIAKWGKGSPSSGDCKSKHEHVSSLIGKAVDGQGAGSGTLMVGKSSSAQGDVDKLESRATKTAVDRERSGTEQRLEPLVSCEGVRKGYDQRLADNTTSGGLMQTQTFSGAELMAKEIRNGKEAGQLEGTMMFGVDGAVDFFNRSEGGAKLFKLLGGPLVRLGEGVGQAISSVHSSDFSPDQSIGLALPGPHIEVTEQAIGGVGSGPLPVAGLSLTTYSRKKRNSLRQTQVGPSEVLTEHKNEVWFVQFSNNGEYLASSSSDCTAITWKVLEDGKFTMTHTVSSHQKPVSFVAWSPDDTMLLTCGNVEVVKLWDVETGACKRTFDHGFTISSCAWFPDSKRHVCGSSDPEKGICMWDCDGNEIRVWRGMRMPKVLEDGKFTMKHTLSSHQKPVSFVAWSPDDTMLLTCGNVEVVKLWDVETGTCKRTFGDHGFTISSCAWFPNSKRLVCGSSDPKKGICM
ncbi:hypothetical protein Ancab_019768 [Ancistrocladus abbreviatus]